MNQYYFRCERAIAGRRTGWKHKRISHNQVIHYDEKRNCYEHQHHRTITVTNYLDKSVVNTGGWNTKTTWEKIHEWSPIRVGAARIKSWTADKYVYWNGGRCATAFYNGIEVDGDGVPLDPKPIVRRRLRRGATKEYYAQLRRIALNLTPRAAIGEFDGYEGKKLTEYEVYHEVEKIIDWMDAHPGEVMLPNEMIGRALFAERINEHFRPRRWSTVDREIPTSWQRLQSNLNAAKRYYLWLDNSLYEKVEEPCDYFSKEKNHVV